MSEADRDLVVASRDGDVRAFGRLVERHHGAVTAVAFAVTRDLSLGEDMAQETFVYAWTRLGELRDPAAVRAWLCNIARNKSKNELRGRKRQVDAPADAVDTKPSVIDAAITREAEAQLRAALADLPDTYREPLVLFYWEEQSIQSVASALDITEQAAQKRISRARSYVQDDLASRFTEASRGRRSAKAAAAAIVAVLASRAAPAAAATAARKAGRSAGELVAIGVAVALVSGALWYQKSSSGVAASRPATTSTAVPVRATGTAPSPSPGQPARLQAEAEPSEDGSGDDNNPDPTAATGSFGTPQGYEVTVLSATSVAVRLAGGPSTSFTWQDPPPPTFVRHVRGRVLDEQGKPLAGAVVVVGDQLPVMWGDLMGQGGAMTTTNGAFDVTVPSEKALSAMALHAQAGWSLTVSVPAGRADADIVIRTSARGGVSGSVRRGGQPIQSAVSVTGDGDLNVNLTTDARGQFEIPLLAPGRYKIKAHAVQLFAGGSSTPVEQDLVIERGTPRVVNLDLPSGALVVVTLRDAAKMSTIEYFLVPGEQAGIDYAKLRVLGRSGKAHNYLLGGQDADRPMQFHDIAPGTYTLCIERKLDRDTALPLICKPLVVPVDKPTLELEIDG